MDDHGSEILSRFQDDERRHRQELARAVTRIREQLARGEDSLGLIEAAERAGDTPTLEALRSEVERFGLVHRVDRSLTTSTSAASCSGR